MLTSRRLRWIAYGSAILLGAGVLGGTANSIATRRGFASNPAPGRLVDVGGHRLHLDCSGSGSVTVVLESALGGWSIDWAKLRPVLAERIRVCAYDRAGYGWSDASGRRYTPEATARELHDLLVAADVPGPYLLVGHSIGGLYVRHFAALYRADVVGMVLVDPSHEDLLARLPQDSDAVEQTKNLKYLRWARFLTATGVTRLLGIPVANSRDLDSAERGIASAIAYRFSGYEAFYNEAASIVEATSAGGAVIGSPDIPVIVLTSSQNAGDPTTGTTWQQLHKEIAASFPRGTTRTIDSGHFIHVESPHAVAAAVNDVIDLS